MARYATLGSLELPLAGWLPDDEQYQRRVLPTDPASETVSGDRPGFSAEPAFRVFATRSWRGGEGNVTWERESRQYNKSSNVRPASIDDGLVLGARQIITPPNGGAGIFNDGRRFGYGLGRLWTCEDSDAYAWDATNQDWDAAVSTGATTNNVISLTDGDDTFMYSSHVNDVIRRWNSGATSEWYATGTWNDPVLRSFRGILYGLDGDDLYTISKGAANTRTLVADIAGSSAVYRADVPWPYGRMSLSDRGPIWLQRLDNGQTFLHLYDPASDTQEVLGKISVDFVFPYSIMFTHGFVWVALRYAPTHAESGDAYLWFKRGAQEGYAGPFRSPTGVTASKPILLAGVIGDDLIVYFDGAVWGYNLTDGAIFMIADQTTTAVPEDAITFGKDIFITPVTSGGNTTAVERFNTVAYTTETATIDLGKHDWDYPGLVKVLYDITVVTDPLPANTTIQAAVSADGAAFVNIGVASDVDGSTRHRFVASSSAGATISGIEFELRLLLASTNVANTPTVREVSARATGGKSLLEIVILVDCGKSRVEAAKFLTALDAIARPATPAIFSLTDPYQAGEKDTVAAFDVKVKEVRSPKAYTDQDETERAALIRVHALDLV